MIVFSALFVLLDQDDVTCNQSKTAIQDVIITLYITLDENGQRIYHTHSHHVWGDKMKKEDGGESSLVATKIQHFMQQPLLIY